MPTVLTEIPAAPPPPQPRRKVWTRAECERLEALGAFEGEHLELVQGELIDKIGKNRPHVIILNRLRGWLVNIFGLEFVN